MAGAFVTDSMRVFIPIWRPVLEVGCSINVMTRRHDTITAERLSIALLTRAAFGTQAGLRSALFYGVHAPLAEEVFGRPAAKIRVHVPGADAQVDRRKQAR
jgi:hypothetical protein